MLILLMKNVLYTVKGVKAGPETGVSLDHP